jgi:hypothetical protein
MGLTSYAGSADNQQLDDQLHLLDLNGLRQIVAFLDTLQVDKNVPNPSQGVRYD